MKKIILLLMLSLTVIFALSCKQSLPETGDFECEFDTKEKTASVTGYNGSENEIIIPDSFGKYTVTAIGREAFSNMYDISDITIPDTVTAIESSAFELCISIEKIELPSSLKKIGNTAFENCRNLKEIYIPKSVENIGICVFTGCTSLEKIEVDADNANYTSDSYGVLLDKDETTIIQFPLGSQKLSYEMPDTVTTISSYAFEKAQYVENVTFSSNLKKIESYAFQSSSITEAVLGDSLEEIGSFCFNESKLTALDLGKSVKNIGDSAFSWCVGLGDVNIPASVESIGLSAFYMCTAVSKYTVDEANNIYASDDRGALFDKTMTTIFYYPIANTEKEYSIPETVVTISQLAFSPCLGLVSITIPDSVETIGEEAFANCTNLITVTLTGTELPKNTAENAFEERVQFTYNALSNT